LDIAANTYKTNWSIGTTNPTTYDLDGNLTQLQRASMGSKPYAYKSGTNTPQTIGSWNYSADATGNITSAGSSSTTMTYDPFTELTMREVKGTRKQNYQYDGKKERVLKIDSNGTVVKTLYLQGLNDYPLMVINGSNEYIYVYGIGGMVAMRVNGTWFYVMRDHLGSTKLIINNTSSVVARYEYDPYGKYLDSLYINTGSAYQFTGQELDETGLYNFRARMYDTSAAIFYAADPAGQGASRYGYCLGNPVSLIDPTGRESTSASDANEMALHLHHWQKAEEITADFLSNTHEYYMETSSGYRATYNTMASLGRGKFQTGEIASEWAKILEGAAKKIAEQLAELNKALSGDICSPLLASNNGLNSIVIQSDGTKFKYRRFAAIYAAKIIYPLMQTYHIEFGSWIYKPKGENYYTYTDIFSGYVDGIDPDVALGFRPHSSDYAWEHGHPIVQDGGEFFTPYQGSRAGGDIGFLRDCSMMRGYLITPTGYVREYDGWTHKEITNMDLQPEPIIYKIQ
jgi:RHS repeat-associated protein